MRGDRFAFCRDAAGATSRLCLPNPFLVLSDGRSERFSAARKHHMQGTFIVGTPRFFSSTASG